MKSAFVIAFLIFALRAGAEELSLSTAFGSVAAFVSAAQGIQPSSSKSDLAKLFTLPEGTHTNPRYQPVAAPDIQSSLAIWSNDTQAIVLVTAAIPAEELRAVVGVLFLLTQKQGVWRIADYQRFGAAGKYARISADLTADTGVGYQLGMENISPVVTVRVTRGGREYSYKASASYTIADQKLGRVIVENF